MTTHPESGSAPPDSPVPAASPAPARRAPRHRRHRGRQRPEGGSPEHPAHRAAELPPLRRLLGQGRLTGRREVVDAAPPPRHHVPAAGQQARALQPVQRRVHGSLRQPERPVAAQSEPGDDLVAVAGAAAEHGQQQQIEVALQLLRLVAVAAETVFDQHGPNFCLEEFNPVRSGIDG